MSGLPWIARLRDRRLLRAVPLGPRPPSLGGGSVEIEAGSVIPLPPPKLAIPERLVHADADGLTVDEVNMIVRLDQWWTAFLALPPSAEALSGHHERQEAQQAVHALQRIVTARLARRQHPGLFG